MQCNAPISRGQAILVAIAGILLGILGIFMICFGAAWDSTMAGSEYIYTIKITGPSIEYPDYWNRYNQVLIWPGFLVLIPAISGVVLLCAKLRSMTILFILSLSMAFVGSISGSALAGSMWQEVLLVYRAKNDDRCKIVDSFCSCTLTSTERTSRTAQLPVGNCDTIYEMHSAISVYFALALISTIFTTVALYIACMVACNPRGGVKESEQRAQLRTTEPPAYGTIYSPSDISTQRQPQVNMPAGASMNPSLAVPGASAPLDPDYDHMTANDKTSLLGMA